MAKFKLIDEIIARSLSNNWDQAKLEWSLDQVYEDEQLDTCLCGKYPIKEICIIQNKYNSQLAKVGNCCVKKFIGLPSDKIFQSVKRVRKNDEKSLNIEAITHAYQKGWINQWEYDFSVDTMRRRKLSDKQLSKRKQINNLVMLKMRRAN